jgi:Ni2+-binding GTPase involved in maturation of urease and hydrogenase
MPKATYIMVGGFLGAGKTTAILKLAQYLTRRGQRVGLITNDQSFGLVDTALLSSHDLPVEEITGGCFCCRFNSVMEAADRLTQAAAPDVFIAEPVGSCTDLRAAVSYPLRRLYGDQFQIAPLSALVDPIRALRILGVEPGKAFSPKVHYIYRKQLEEADLILINKCDLLSPGGLRKLEAVLSSTFPKATILTVSARVGTGLESWFERITRNGMWDSPAPEVDYEIYAQGEALLGWFNATIQLAGAAPFDGNALLGELAKEIHNALAAEAIEIAHLKMTLMPGEDGSDIGVLNLVSTDRKAELSHSLREPLEGGELIINLRAEGDPETLSEIVTKALSRAAGGGLGLNVVIEHTECFCPAKPTPTYRMAVP